MNHIYRTIWNQALGVWQATSEHAAGRGKPKSSRTLKQRAAVLGLLAASPMLHGQGIVTDGRIDASFQQPEQLTSVGAGAIWAIHPQLTGELSLGLPTRTVRPGQDKAVLHARLVWSVP